MLTAEFCYTDINKLILILFRAIELVCGLSGKASHIMSARTRTEFEKCVDTLHSTYGTTLLRSMHRRLNTNTDLSAMTKGLLHHYWIHNAAGD